jgi:hypothetical protein
MASRVSGFDDIHQGGDDGAGLPPENGTLRDQTTRIPTKIFTCQFNMLVSRRGQADYEISRAVPDRYIGRKSCD